MMPRVAVRAPQVRRTQVPVENDFLLVLFAQRRRPVLEQCERKRTRGADAIVYHEKRLAVGGDVVGVAAVAAAGDDGVEQLLHFADLQRPVAGDDLSGH